MTDREHAPPAFPSPYDAAIASRVDQLLADRGESVLDLAHFTGISLAALYRKLAGGARWSAADVGRIAEHYGVRPGELFGDRAPASAPPAPRAALVDPLTRPFSHAGSASARAV